MSKIVAIIFLIVATTVGYMLPEPFTPYFFHQIRLFDAGLAVCVGALVLAAFQIIQPANVGWRWVAIRGTLVPLSWALLLWMLWALLSYAGRLAPQDFTL